MPIVTSTEAQEQLPGWTVVDGRLEISVLAKDFEQAIEFVNRFADVAEDQDHHPDFEIRYNTIRMRVLSHDVGQLTDRDVKFATEVDRLIEELELKRQPKKIARSHMVLVSPDVQAILPFWQALLNFKESNRDDSDGMLVDKSDVLPPIRFHQRPDASTPEDDLSRSGVPVSMHTDVFVPADLAEERMQAAIAAGGKLISEGDAPAMWELADLDGNRVYLRSEPHNS